jgi:hypothetical protein
VLTCQIRRRHHLDPFHTASQLETHVSSAQCPRLIWCWCCTSEVNDAYNLWNYVLEQRTNRLRFVSTHTSTL